MTSVVIKNITTNDTTRFPSIGRLARAISVNAGSVVYYAKVGKPIVVKEGQSVTITPGAYVIKRA